MWEISLLPKEILLQIFASIPAHDIARNAVFVSKLFHELGVDPILWKHFCEDEFGINVTGNVYPPNDWQSEYFVMSNAWITLSDNELRIDNKYDGLISLKKDVFKCSLFTNIRPRNTLNPSLTPMTAQSVLPLRPLPLGDFSLGYYEIKLEAEGDEQMIGLGLARNNYLDAMPGWKKGSIGYHGDDGRVFIGCGYGRTLTEPWTTGDIYGCGVDFRRKFVFFTKNGSLLGTYPLRRAEGFYPTIGSRTEGESVTVNFGTRPFCFDLFKYQTAMASSSPAPAGVLAVPYSKLVYSCKGLDSINLASSSTSVAPSSLSSSSTLPSSSFFSSISLPYDEEDDVEDEDNEFDDKGMNKASQYFNSVLRVLMNADDYPNDDGSLESLVAVLRSQMQDSGYTLPPDMGMPELRQALSTHIQFNKQSALLAYFLRVHEDGKLLTMLEDNLLPRDEFPKNEIIKCIATLLIDDYRDDHPLVLNTINRGRMLFNFHPPAGMTIMEERGQLSLVLSREIQAHERERRAKRREIFRSLRAKEPTYYYYNENPLRDYSILLGNYNFANINNNNSNNNHNNNENNNNHDDVVIHNNTEITTTTTTTTITTTTTQTDVPTQSPTPSSSSSIPTTPTNNNPPNASPCPFCGSTTCSANASSPNSCTNNDPSLSPQQFQDMLKSYVTLLNDRNIPDDDPRITSAICQWYTTLDIEMRPDMQVSIERNRLVSVLQHLHVKVDEHIEDHTTTSFFGRVGTRVRRIYRNITKSFNRDSTIRISFIVLIGCLIASTFQKKKP